VRLIKNDKNKFRVLTEENYGGRFCPEARTHKLHYFNCAVCSILVEVQEEGKPDLNYPAEILCHNDSKMLEAIVLAFKSRGMLPPRSSNLAEWFKRNAWILDIDRSVDKNKSQEAFLVGTTQALPIQYAEITTGPFFVDTSRGRQIGQTGDYLIILSSGERTICKRDMFALLFQGT